MFKKIYNYIPSYAALPLLVCVIFNFTVYSGSRLFYGNRVFYDLTSYYDNKIPTIPFFVLIYLGSYIFWIFNYILISRINKDNCYRLVTSDLLGKLICFILYITFPTTNIRPSIATTGIFTSLLQFLYNTDAANNLFPSIHCLVSWYCFAGLRNCKTIPAWYRHFSLFIALMIFISTLATKQHVIVDVLGGVIFAELTWQLSSYFKFKFKFNESIIFIKKEEAR